MSTLFYNYTILKDNLSCYPNGYAIYADDGIIRKIDKLENVIEYLDKSNIRYSKVDGNNMVIMPSFCDSHSHISKVLSDMCYLNLEDVSDINALKEAFNNFESLNPNDELIIANNCQIDLSEVDKCEEILDSLSSKPIIINYVNGHMGFFNKASIAKFDNCNYILKETSYFNIVTNLDLSGKMLQYYPKAMDYYIERGYTLVCDGYVTKSLVDFYSYILSRDDFDKFIKCNLNLIVESSAIDYCYTKLPQLFKRDSQNRSIYYKNTTVSAIKLVLDGSLQSKTAYISGLYPDNTNGMILLDSKTIKDTVKKAYELNTNIHIHVNGDLAIKELIKILYELDLDMVRKVNITLIHAQTLDVSDLKDIKNLNMNVSFFASHIYHYADTHIKLLGYDKAKDISPVKSSLEYGIVTTIHDDTPVVEANCLKDFTYILNRVSKENVALNPKEKCDLSDLLLLSTLNSFKQYHLQEKYDFIKENSVCNFIICDKNLFEISSNKIDKIKILDVIFEEKSILH